MSDNLPAPAKEQSPAQKFRAQMENRSGEFAAALPPHIPPDRFKRVILTAVTSNPDLLNADRRSLMDAAMKAAQDGLLPDGRDGAFVTFKGKVQWMPMVRGILKQVRNSGQLLSISAYVAYEKDEFYYSLGDNESIEHKPAMGERGKPIFVYAVAKTKHNGTYREVMTVREVEKVRAVSRAKDSGPWKDWWDEMARKTVIRRLSKRLPMSSDLDDLLRRDDALYAFEKPDFKKVANPLSDRPPPPVIEHDPETGEVTVDADGGDEDTPAEEKRGEATVTSGKQTDPPAKSSGPSEDDLAEATKRGDTAARKGRPRTVPPVEFKGNAALTQAWQRGWDNAKAAAADTEGGE